MVGTINPVVYRGRRITRWSIAAQLHILGSAVGGAFTGLLLGLMGSWVFGRVVNCWPVLVAVLGFLGVGYGLVELRLLRLPRPQLTRQVPKSWRARFHPWITATLYGVGLGTGVTTRIVTGIVYIVVVGLVGIADPLYGMAIFSLFGLSRGASAMAIGLITIRAQTGEQVSTLTRRLVAHQDAARFMAGMISAAVGGYWWISFFLLVRS